MLSGYTVSQEIKFMMDSGTKKGLSDCRKMMSFPYQAGTWDKARRVVCKIEWHEGELFPRVGFIVTNSRLTAGKVVKVFDGDTLTIESGGKKYNVRLAGIDTPERSYTRTLNAMERMADFAPLARRRELAAAMKPLREWGKALQGHAKAARKTLAALVKGKVVELTVSLR